MEPFNPKISFDEQSEGPVNYRIGSFSGKVVIEFDRQVKWIGLNVDDIPDMVSRLRIAAARIKRAHGIKTKSAPKRRRYRK